MRAEEFINENLHKWFKEKWVRFGPDGKIRGDCARGSDSEGKPKCLPQSKAHALGKKGRASAAARKRRQDPNPERSGPAKNVATKEAANPAQQAAIAIAKQKSGKYNKAGKRIKEGANPADTLYFFDVARGGRSFDHLDLRIMGLKQSQKGRWYYQPGRDSTDLITNATIKHLEKTLNVPARAWHRPVTESPRIARKPGQPAHSSKHSDLYTDENPRGTITGLKFATVQDAKSSVSKIRGSGRSHAHKIQAAVAMEQRARAAGKSAEAAVYRAYINSAKKANEDIAQDQLDEKWSKKYKSSINCSHPKGFSQKAHCAGKRKHNESVDLEMTCPDCGMCETHGDHTRDTLDEACWKGYHKEGMKTMFGKQYPNCVKNKKTSEDTIQEFVEETVGRKNSDEIRRIQQMLNKKFGANLDVDGVLGPLTKKSIARFLPSADTQPAPDPERTTQVQGLKQKATEQQCPECGGPMFSELMITEKQDACYYKVKSRYKVWPSAYASGALVQCRKKGAANWGNKSK
jgi:predicted RNA-binding Zn-ribbon protein involved in translation (DUF1610 family)